jgi:hypothetical protein
MPRPSSIDKLPEEIRAEIGRLRMRGCTIDAILTTLRAMTPDAPSRSALGRHMLRMDALGEKMRRSRQVAEALVETLGDAPESQAAKLNIELLHSTVMDLFMSAAEDETEGLDEGGIAALKGNPMGVMMLAKAVESLTKASRSNQDFIVAAEKRATERAKKAAVASVEAVAREGGISAATLQAIKAGIFGVAA